MPGYELAQFNLAHTKAPLGSAAMAEFEANLDRINALADAAPGFVWRLQTEAGNATALRPFGDRTLVNVSVWRDLAALQDFVYRSAHVDIMRRRQEWFEPMREAYLVLWWIRSGDRPTVREAFDRLSLLRFKGPSAQAFTFRQPYGCDA